MKARGQLNEVRQHAEELFEALDRTCFIQSKELFSNILPKLAFDPGWIAEQVQPRYFRCYSNEFNPLSIAGSLADGARLNIGGSQASGPAKIFEPLGKKRGALYLSESWQTAIMESYGGVTAPAFLVNQIKNSTAVSVFEVSLRSRKRLKVVDYEKAIGDIQGGFPTLNALLATTNDMNGHWGDLKRPAPCQLLAHWLVDNAGRVDGIRFQSTVDPLGFNVCLYLKDDRAAGKLLKSSIFQLP